MSLDAYLTLKGAQTPSGSGIFIRENGATIEISEEEWNKRNPDREPVKVKLEETDIVWSGNITHNLGKMAEAAACYECLWHPEELGIKSAKYMASHLAFGIDKLIAEPDYYKTFNPKNGWGTYEVFLSFMWGYFGACIKYPDAEISVSR